jgi:hypothetical protein
MRVLVAGFIIMIFINAPTLASADWGHPDEWHCDMASLPFDREVNETYAGGCPCQVCSLTGPQLDKIIRRFGQFCGIDVDWECHNPHCTALVMAIVRITVKCDQDLCGGVQCDVVESQTPCWTCGE